jgi:hypothetical protein
VQVGDLEEDPTFRDTLPEMFVQLSMYLAYLPAPARFRHGRQPVTGRMSA